jgi:hypothetical protein
MRTRKSKDPDPAQAARLTSPAASDAGEGAVPRGRSGPARFGVAIPGLQSTTWNARPPRNTRPDAQPPAEIATSGRPMSARAHEVAMGRAASGFEQLHPIARLEPGQPAVPKTVGAMRDLNGLLDAVGGMFGTGPASEALSLRLLGAVPPERHGDTPYLQPLVLATALHATGAQTPQAARALIEQARQGELSPQLFRLERALAATAPGMQALAHLRGVQDQPVQVQHLRDSLNLCAEIERQGVRLHRHSSVESVVRDLEATAETRMHADIGRADDAPLQLLAKATRHALALHAGAGQASAELQGDRAAFVAWKQGGFVKSGEGSDFNKAIGRMHKFMTYVDRADHGPRSLGSLVRDTASYFGRAMGVGKSPLSATRYGTLGGERGLLQEEAGKVRQQLQRALTTAVDHLVDELRTPAPGQTDDARHGQLARAAVLDLWREHAGTDHAVQAVVDRAGELMARAGAPMTPVDEAALVKGLRGFTRKVRSESGEPTIRVGMRALEALAVARTWRRERQPETPAATALGASPTPAQRRAQLTDLLKELRAVEQVGADAKPLFKLSDLKSLLRGQPREGPTAADAQRMMTAVAQSPRVAFSNLSDGATHGVGSLGALALRAGALIGTPIVYPVLGLEAGKAATVSVGQYPTGGRLFIGTETSRSGAVGVGAGWVAPPLTAQLVTGLAVGQAAVSHTRTHAQGLSITARNDTPGSADKLPQAIDFLFQQASLKEGAGRAQEPAALWSRFAERFGDDPHIGISWVDERAVTSGASINATAVARVQAGVNTSIGPGLTAGASVSGTRLERSVNADGADIPMAIHSRQGSAGLSLGVSQTVPFVQASTDRAVAGWGAGLPLVGASVDWRAAGGLGIARLGRDQDGRLNPALCQREILFTESKAAIAYVNRHRETWEAAMVAKDPTGSTRHEHARERLNTFVQDAAQAGSPLALHGEFASLSPAVANHINALEARLTTMLGHGDQAAASRHLSAEERQECQALQNEVHRQLQAESSWEPGALYSTESHSRASTTGLNLGLRMTNQEQGSSLHVTALLLASAPARD